MNSYCDTCGSKVAICDENCRCTISEYGHDSYDPYAIVNGYKQSGATTEMVDKPSNYLVQSKEFRTSDEPGAEIQVIENREFDEGKIVVKLSNAHTPIEGLLCPIHNTEIWEVEEKYYCPFIEGDGTPCTAEASRWYGDHEVTVSELTEIFAGIPLLWELKRKKGLAIYTAFAFWDYENNQLVIEPVRFAN